ncbi:MAG: YfbM family protein [Planctomycetia bacterium]|nr:YfbM family protein [Planctomycetia bacterium]
MSCLGVHFVISAEQATRLLKAKDDEELVSIVQEEIEEAMDDDNSFQTDKAWDALHRCLSDGTLNVRGGKPPLNKTFFGGKVLNTEADYFVVLLTPREVQSVASALSKVSEDWLRKRYETLNFKNYQCEKSAEDWEYSWSNFRGLPEFFKKAAKAEQHVIFTVDQ